MHNCSGRARDMSDPHPFAVQFPILRSSHSIMLPSQTFARTATGIGFFSDACSKNAERPETNLKISAFRLNCHFGPILASDAVMRLVFSLQDRLKRGCPAHAITSL